jgi:multidrug efflux pump subunit AcrB
MWMTRVSIANPVFATMVMVALAVLGLFSYQRLKVEQMPEVALPFVLVLTSYPGAAPEAVETDVTKPIEYALNQIAGVKLIRSNSLEGNSQVFAEFRLDTDVTRAMQDVRDKIALVKPNFPRDVKDPLVIRADNENEQPIVSLAVMSPTVGLRELTSLTDNTIVKALESLPGVAKIDVNGRVTRQVLIRIKPDALTALGIGVDQVMDAVRTANQDVPAGRITRGASDAVVRVEGKLREPAQFGRIIVAQQGGGPIYMSQVADVIDGEKEETSIARINGRPAITIDIRKAQDANIVDTGRHVTEALASLKGRLPADVTVTVANSSADAVERSVNRVKQTIVEGALLTVLIVFLFLHSWRSTVITGLTLPISVIATFIALYAFGFTLNFLTLMALSLCIGLLIDDAIVVRENIVRHLAMGKSHRQAAQEATDEIGLAVMATTFAIVAVFVPIAFMQGLIGRFFYQFGVTVAVAVMVSLFVSFTLDPMLSAVWRDPPEGRFRRARWLGRVMEIVERGVEALHRIYGSVLDWALEHRKSVLAIALLLFLASFAVPPLVGTEFVPEGDEGFISLRMSTPVGSSLEYTDGKVARSRRR